jgi:hypothetical protein
MTREVLTVLRELRPEEGLGEGIDQLTALVHHAYLFWSAGEHVVAVFPQDLGALLRAGPSDRALNHPPAYYAQLPERRVWAEVILGRPHEPLDGWFVHTSSGPSSLRMLAVFGVHPERDGFSVVEATGPRPGALARDGSPLFASVLPGGAAAGLYSIVGEEELLELGWRVQLGAGNWEPAASSNRPARSDASQSLAPSS